MARKSDDTKSATHVDVLRGELYLAERALTEAVHLLTEAVTQAREARLAYNRAFSAYLNAKIQRRRI